MNLLHFVVVHKGGSYGGAPWTVLVMLSEHAHRGAISLRRLSGTGIIEVAQDG